MSALLYFTQFSVILLCSLHTRLFIEQNVDFRFWSSDLEHNLCRSAFVCLDFKFYDGVTSAMSGNHLDIQFLNVLRNHLLCSLLFRLSCNRAGLTFSCILEDSGYCVDVVHTRHKNLHKCFLEQRKIK